MALACSILRSTADWEALTPEWLALWQRSPASKPFQHPDWLLPWWRAFSQQCLLVLVLRREAELLAMLPFYVYPDPAAGGRKLLLAGAGTSDYLDGVFSEDCTGKDLLRALVQLKEEAWDRADLTQLCPESLLYASLRQISAPSLTRTAGEPCGRRPASAVSGLPSKLRAEVRYQANAAGSLGKLTLQQAAAQDWEFAFAELVRLHTDRWRQSGEAGVLADPCVLAHHREALPAMIASGVARLDVLRAGEHVLGVLYSLLDPSYRAQRTQYFYLMGHALQFERFKPGILLLALAMQEAWQNSIAAIDMLRGNESYKKFWRLEVAPTCNVSFLPESIEAAP